MRKFLSAKALIGLALVLTVVAVAILAPFFIAPERATQMVMSARLQPPSLAYPLGTDQLGRDLLARVMLGAQTSLMIAVLAVGMSIVLGLPLGIISGYFGGRIDNVLMRIIDALLSFPALLLALTISAVLGPNLQNTIIAIGIALHAIPRADRAGRGAARGADCLYVEAARAAGTRDGQMILRHILPNIMPALIVQATISLAFAVLAEAALSFLGLGTQPPMASWGLMIQASRQFLDIAPWTALVPGAALAITILGLNLLGDVLRDVLDPRVR